MEDLINDEILERLHEEVVEEWMEILSEGARNNWQTSKTR